MRINHDIGNRQCSNPGHVPADAPIKDIHTFIGTFTINRPPPENAGEMSLLPPKVEPLTVENVLWANTVLAAGSAVGFVIYTGEETRAVMNTSHPETKVGLLDLEIEKLAMVSRRIHHLSDYAVANQNVDAVQQILCAVTLALSLVLVALNGFRGLWYIYVFRFLILFSSIIPIRLVPHLCLRNSELMSRDHLVCGSTWTWARQSMQTK